MKLHESDVYKLSKSVYVVNGISSKEGNRVYLICKDHRKDVRKDYGWKLYEGATPETSKPNSFTHDRKSKAFDEVAKRCRTGVYVPAPQFCLSEDQVHAHNKALREASRAAKDEIRFAQMVIAAEAAKATQAPLALTKEEIESIVPSSGLMDAILEATPADAPLEYDMSDVAVMAIIKNAGSTQERLTG